MSSEPVILADGRCTRCGLIIYGNGHVCTGARAVDVKHPVVSLLDEWLADESGYDEETWPKLHADLEGGR